MNQEDKQKHLQEMSEAVLRIEVLVPLFQRMGCEGVDHFHGGREKGKDIVYYTLDEFGERHYTGVVVKRGKISGAASGKGNFGEVLTQVRQCFLHPYPDPGVGEVAIERCVVVASGKIAQAAQEEFAKEREQQRPALRFIDGPELVALVDKHLPELFWQEREQFQAYYAALKEDTSAIRDLQPFELEEPLELKKVYVSLRLEGTGGKRTGLERLARGKGRRPTQEEMRQMEDAMEAPGAKMDVEDALGSFDRLVIVGDPGSGKTTLLRHLALTLAEQHLESGGEAKIPIPVTLRHLIDAESPSLDDFLVSVLTGYGFSDADEHLPGKLEAGQCLLLLDGFDEVADAQQQKKVAKAILSFVKQHEECQVVVTSRKAGYRDELKGFTKLSILELDDEQIKRFAENWFGEGSKADRLVALLARNERLTDLARNPLLLSILCIIYLKDDEDLPRRRCALYERCVDLLLHSWKARQGVKTSKSKPDAKLHLLTKLATELHSSQQREIEEAKLIDFAVEHCPGRKLSKARAGDLVQELHVHNGILRETARGRYDFLHLSFQEYLVARDLHQGRDDVAEKLLFEHVKDSWWQEALLLYLGLRRDATDLMPKVWATAKDDKGLVAFAASSLVDADWTSEEAKEEVAKGIFGQILTEDTFSDDLPKMKAGLARVGRDIVPELTRFLDDPKWQVVRHAADIIGAIHDPDAVEPLVGLTEHPNGNVRYSALAGIMNQKDGRADEVVRSTHIIDPKKLKGKKPFEIEVRGQSVVVNEDGKHPGMVFISEGRAKGFWMDMFPVTNGEFETVIKERSHPRSDFVADDDSPATNLTWEEAAEYAKKVGKRLQTEQEWEFAAAGPHGHKYPWGGSENPDVCRTGLDVWAGASRVNTVYFENVSDFGCFEMAGNAWEWTADWYDAKDRDLGHAVRGGAWYSDFASCGCGARFSSWHDVVSYDFGFRCCQ